MSIASIPLRIAQISDLHCGELTFQPEVMRSIVERINRMSPDVVVVVGDLTAAGYEWEFEECADWLAQIEAPHFDEADPARERFRTVSHELG